MTRIAAYTVNWNNAKDTIDCIDSLINYNLPLDIYVVDNASSDDSLSELKQFEDRINLICSEVNLGYPGGANLALSEILEGHYDYILSINNDALLGEGVLESLISTMEGNPKIGMIGPWVVYRESNKIWFSGGKYYSWLGITSHPKLGSILDENRSKLPEECDYLCGCCALFRTEIFDSTGLFEEDLFLYGEDLLHSLMAKKNGWSICTLPTETIEHGVSSSTGDDSSKHFSPLRAYYYARNPLLILSYLPWSPKKLIAILSQVFIALPYSTIRMLFEGTMFCFPNYIRGLMDGILLRKGNRVKLPNMGD